MRVETRLLNLVRVLGETAAEHFETLKEDLGKHDIEITNLVGFAADTTNVIFGANNSVASRIIAANPHCLTIKCACHSCALAVTHACSTLPKNMSRLSKNAINFSHFQASEAMNSRIS